MNVTLCDIKVETHDNNYSCNHNCQYKLTHNFV